MKVAVLKSSTSKTNKCETPKDKAKPVLAETSLKPVLAETSLKSVENNSEVKEKSGDCEKIDENANNNNVECMETEEASTSVENKKAEGSELYSKVFEAQENDGFIYNILYEG